MKKVRFSKKTKESLKKIGVEVIYLFGSMAEGVGNKNSDYDIGIVLKNDISSSSLQLCNLLDDILRKEFGEKKLDIVLLRDAPVHLQFEVISYGKVIFEVSCELRANFEETVTRNYLDFAPFLKEYDYVTLETFK